MSVRMKVIEDYLDIVRAKRKYGIDRANINRSPYSIGEGSGGKVYKATLRDRDGYEREVVIKYLLGTHNDALKMQKRLLRELVILSQINHPHVSRLYGIVEDPIIPIPGLVSNFIQYILMDYISIYPHVKIRMLKEITSGLQYLHSDQFVIHGDIKPDNIRVSAQGRAIIIDFGLGKIGNVTGFTTKGLNMNPRYTAPEIIISDSDDFRPTFHSDVFSLSMCFLQVLHGRDFVSPTWDQSIPYNHIKPYLPLVTAICEKGDRPRRERYSSHISDAQWRLLERCWSQEARRRPNIGDIVLELDLICIP